MTSNTRPTGEQIRFVSAKTGTHDLDQYLEAVERGTRTLSDIISDMWDPTTGALRSNNMQYRINPTTSMMQSRLGDFVSATAGWQDVTNGSIFNQRGAHANATAYARLDVVTHTDGLWICRIAHTSNTANPNPTNFALAIPAPNSTAATVPFTPTGTIAATNIQAAIEELDSETQTALSTLTTNANSRALASRTLTAGTGITGGGDLTANRTFTFDATWGDARYRQISGTVAWGSLTSVPSTFAPSAHTHPVADISNASANGRSLITAADYSAMRTLLALVPGTDVQAQNALLSGIITGGSGANLLPYYTGTNAVATTSLTAFGRSLIDDADAAAGRATLGLGTAALSATGDFVAPARAINTSTGITGGGNLTADRTLSFDTTWGDGRYRQISGTVAWGSLTGIPSTFAPSAHVHPISDVTGLQANLNTLQAGVDAGAGLQTTVSLLAMQLAVGSRLTGDEMVIDPYGDATGVAGSSSNVEITNGRARRAASAGARTVSAPNLFADNNMSQPHCRIRIPNAQFASAEGWVRVRLCGSNNGTNNLRAVIGEAAASGDRYDFHATPTNLLFNGAVNFSMPNITIGVEFWTDWIQFAPTGGRDVIISVAGDAPSTGTIPTADFGSTGWESWTKVAASAFADLSVVDATGYTAQTFSRIFGGFETTQRGNLATTRTFQMGPSAGYWANSGDWSGTFQNWRWLINPATTGVTLPTTGRRVCFAFRGSAASNNIVFGNMFAALNATSGNAWDLAAAPTRLTINGQSSWTLPPDTVVWTDPIDLVVPSGRQIVVTGYTSVSFVNWGRNSGALTANTGIAHYWKATATDESQQLTPTGYGLNGAGLWGLMGFEFASQTASFTLNTPNYTADAQPSNGRIGLLVLPGVDNITPGTNLRAWVSRNGGTNENEVTLTLRQNLLSGTRYYEGAVSIAGQPAGTSMRMRVENTIDLQLDASLVSWS